MSSTEQAPGIIIPGYKLAGEITGDGFVPVSHPGSGIDDEPHLTEASEVATDQTTSIIEQPPSITDNAPIADTPRGRSDEQKLATIDTVGIVTKESETVDDSSDKLTAEQKAERKARRKQHRQKLRIGAVALAPIFAFSVPFATVNTAFAYNVVQSKDVSELPGHFFNNMRDELQWLGGATLGRLLEEDK